MNTVLLQTFLEVAKTRHFGHAAENLYLNQSTVSARIRQLEELLGVTVFTRQKKSNILLTPAGERLLPHAENILASWQQTIQEVGIPQEQSMQIALGATSNLWDTFLQSRLPDLARQFTGLHIRTEINPPQHLIRSLLSGRLDIAVMLDAPTNTELDDHLIGGLELVMVCNHPGQSIDDIAALGHVFVDWGTAFNLQQAKLFSDPTPPILHTGQGHIALEFILGFEGAAYLPRTTVSHHLKQGELFIVEGIPEVRREVHLVHTKNIEKLENLKPIINFLKSTNLQLEAKQFENPETNG